MENILYLAHTNADGSLPKVALETLAAAINTAKKLGGDLTVGLVGKDIQAAADMIAGSGASKFIGVSGPDFEQARYCSDAHALEALIRTSGATVVMAPNTSRFARVLPGVSSRVDGRIDTRISSVEASDGAFSVQRWYYRQRMLATLSRTQRPWILLIDSGIAPAWTGAAGSASIEMIPVEIPVNVKRTEVSGIQSPSSSAQTICPDAELLLVAGAGWTKKQADGKAHVKEAEGLILSFLDKAKASLGSSKSLVDQKSEGEDVFTCMSHLNQVGQTGASPRHAKGLSTCCHGEEPHVVGWRFVNERRAINLDANCGWAQGKADVLYVADAFAVMSKVDELLSK